MSFTPANAGQYKFTVKVSNSAGYDEKEFICSVDKRIAAKISDNTELAAAVAGQRYTAGTSEDYYLRSDTLGNGNCYGFK